MIRELCNFMFIGKGQCKNDLHQFALIKAKTDEQEHLKKIALLEQQVVELLGQIQELKAVSNYQALDFEKKIAELEAKITEYTKCDKKKVKP